MRRIGWILPLAEIIGGFTAAGYLVQQSGSDPSMGPRDLARAAATALSQPGSGDTVRSADTPTAAEVVAKSLAKILNEAAPSGPAETARVPSEANRAQIAAKSLAEVLKPEAGAATQLSSKAPTVAGEVAQATGKWLTEVVPAEPAWPPAPKIAQAPQAPAPVEPTPAPGVEKAPIVVEKLPPATPVPAAPAELPQAAQVAPEPPPPPAPAATEPPKAAETPAPDQAARDEAGSIADSLTKGFNDIMKSITGAETTAPEGTPAPAQSPPGSAPPQVATEVTVPPASRAAEMVFSSLRYDPAAGKDGMVTLSGRGVPGRRLTVSLDAELVGVVTVAQNGRWLIEVAKSLTLGSHEARAEHPAPDGKPTHSAVFTFERRPATVAGGESAIVPLAMTATAPAPAEPAPSPPKVAEAPAPLKPLVIPSGKPSQPAVRQADAKPADTKPAVAAAPVKAKTAGTQAQSKPARTKPPVAEAPARPSTSGTAAKLARTDKPKVARTARRLAAAPVEARPPRSSGPKAVARKVARVHIPKPRRVAVSAAARSAGRHDKVAVRIWTQARPAPRRVRAVGYAPRHGGVTVNTLRQGGVKVRIYKGASKVVTLYVPEGVLRGGSHVFTQPRVTRRKRTLLGRRHGARKTSKRI